MASRLIQSSLKKSLIRTPLIRLASTTTKYNRTPLYDFHTSPENGGKMVEFAGYEMPLNYEGKVGENIAGGPVAEHHQVRKSSGLFDVGHMVQSTYTGPGALKFLQRMLPASLSTLPVPKGDRDALKSTLSVLLNPEGGIIDDCMITRWGEESFYLVTNAGRAERDLTWLTLNVHQWNESNKDQVRMEILSGWGLIALQGPKSHLALQRLLPSNYSLQDSLHFSSSVFLPLTSNSSPVHIARGGYTGEDGFEISLPASLTTLVSQLLLDQPEVKLAGLAARDSLRLEAGLCLYGHDLDESTGVGEAGLGWVVGKDRRVVGDGAFIGSERTLKELKKGGTERKRIGLVVEKGPPAREGAKIFTSDGSKEIGIVTSGLPSPTTGTNISMGYIQTKDGLNKKDTEVLVEVRKKMRKATVVTMPWITPGYYRG